MKWDELKAIEVHHEVPGAATPQPIQSISNRGFARAKGQERQVWNVFPLRTLREIAFFYSAYSHASVVNPLLSACLRCSRTGSFVKPAFLGSAALSSFPGALPRQPSHGP